MAQDRTNGGGGEEAHRPAPASGGSELWSREREVSPEEAGRTLDVYGSVQTSVLQLTGGAFLTGYALALNAGTILIGVIASLPLLARLTQLYSSWWIEKAGHWRKSAITAASVASGVLLFAAAIPFAISPVPLQPWALVLVMGIAAFAGSIFDLAYLTWIAELVPTRIRGRFLGKRNRVGGVAGQATALTAAFFLDRWQRANPAASPAGFAFLFALAGVLGLLGLLVLRRVPAPRRRESRIEHPSVRAALVVPARDANFRRMLAFAGCFHFGLGLAGPFITVFMLRDLGLPIFVATGFGAVTMLTMALTLPYWGYMGDQFGSKTALRVGTYLITLPLLLWFFVTPERIWPILPIQLLGGIGWGAYNANLNNLALKLAPMERRPSFVAALGAVSGAGEAVAPLVGGVILGGLETAGVPALHAFYILIVISLAVRAAATLLPAYVHEPGGVTVGRMVRVLGRFRTLSVAEPLVPVLGYVYHHLARVADFIAREPASGRPASRPGPAGH